MRAHNPEADLAWLLLPSTRITGPETKRVLQAQPFDRVDYLRDPYGSHRFIGFVDGEAVAGIQVVKGARSSVVANVYTVPYLRGRGMASALLRAARRRLGKIAHSQHLTESGARFAARRGNPERPPKKWWRNCVRGVTESGSAADPESVCGSVWYHKMSAAERRAATRKYEKNPLYGRFIP